MPVSKTVAQNYIQRLLANEHDTLKWAWIIVMGGALIEASLKMASLFPCWFSQFSEFLSKNFSYTLLITDQTRGEVMARCLGNDLIVESFVAFCLFVVTFLRFLWGDNRILDAKYKEIVGFIEDARKSDESHARMSAASFDGKDHFLNVVENHARRFTILFDIGFVLVHAVLFVFLAVNITDVYIFTYLYVVLLGINTLWLTASSLATSSYHAEFWRGFLGDRGRGLDGDVTALNAPWIWSGNNIAHVLLLIVVIGMSDNKGMVLFGAVPMVWVCLALIATNCFCDFLLTFNTYFPRIDRIYDALVLPEMETRTDHAEPSARQETKGTSEKVPDAS